MMGLFGVKTDDGDVVKLPPPASLQHKFAEPVSVKGPEHQQTERTCEVCHCVKITVHGWDNLSWREWRLAGGPQFVGPAPRCEVKS
jgi:hypothetical protein